MDPLLQPMLGQERVPTSHFHQAVLAPHKHLGLPISRQPGRCVSLPQLIVSTCLSLKAASMPACLQSGKGIKETNTRRMGQREAPWVPGVGAGTLPPLFVVMRQGLSV